MRAIKYIVTVAAAVTIAVFGFIYLAPATTLHLVISVERCRSGLQRKEIDLPGGTRYVYLEGGKGEPLMLLHGFGGDKDNFTRVARYLTPRYRVIAPDLAGFGESSHLPDADYSAPAQAARLRALAAALGIRALHLGGNSMGGQIAITYAALYPSEVKSLWLLDPGGIWSVTKGDFRAVARETGHNPLLIMDEDSFARMFEFAMSRRPFMPRPLLDVMARARIANRALESVIYEQISGFSVEKIIRGSTVPALIAWGAGDRVISAASAEILHGLMPNSRVIIMRGIGHVPMLEDPAQSAGDYLRFRDSL